MGGELPQEEEVDLASSSAVLPKPGDDRLRSPSVARTQPLPVGPSSSPHDGASSVHTWDTEAKAHTGLHPPSQAAGLSDSGMGINAEDPVRSLLPGRGCSPDHAGTLTLDVQPPDLQWRAAGRLRRKERAAVRAAPEEDGLGGPVSEESRIKESSRLRAFSFWQTPTITWHSQASTFLPTHGCEPTFHCNINLHFPEGQPMAERLVPARTHTHSLWVSCPGMLVPETENLCGKGRRRTLMSPVGSRLRKEDAWH
ncbi:uncharacterized protein LOC123652246 [Pipistrellus kuhlii]|uniref:uncharacterized protein LOC123652246 n=1 Tax=Pipistrellus kuhlii TaxID=59472 RepID=UPI001E2723DB|nr:uncharacterized protein LOC123652246 [Pipistrellus kuhlii]